VKPKNDRTLTPGQSPISAFSAADHAFIASEIADSLGRLVFT
jgi:hypothetical protein